MTRLALGAWNGAPRVGAAADRVFPPMMALAATAPKELPTVLRNARRLNSVDRSGESDMV